MELGRCGHELQENPVSKINAMTRAEVGMGILKAIGGAWWLICCKHIITCGGARKVNSLDKSYQYHLLVLCTQTPRSYHGRKLINLIRYTIRIVGLVWESEESNRGRVITNL